MLSHLNHDPCDLDHFPLPLQCLKVATDCRFFLQHALFIDSFVEDRGSIATEVAEERSPPDTLVRREAVGCISLSSQLNHDPREFLDFYEA
jgi:hypothetical protein